MIVGIFDSGLGGLTIYASIRRLLPGNQMYYLADQAHFPYGNRSNGEIFEVARRAVEKLLKAGCELIVIGCNTVTTTAIGLLRQTYPEICFVGVVPPVKIAAQMSQSGKIAVLATPATCKSQYLDELITRWAPQKTVWKVPCEGLVQAIENGDRAKARLLLSQTVAPMIRERAIDVLASGCTHFPLVRAEIQDELGITRFIEPGEAVAAQVKRLVGSIRKGQGETAWETTGDKQKFRQGRRMYGF